MEKTGQIAVPFHFNVIIDGGKLATVCPICGKMYYTTEDYKMSKDALDHYLSQHS